jgi:hypothetical protein
MILEQKVVEIRQFSRYFKSFAKKNNFTYVFDVLIQIDSLYRYRGLSKKSADEVKGVLQEYLNPMEEAVKEVEEIVENISILQIKSFPKIVESKQFRKLENYFRELHKKGYSNKRVLPELTDQSIGLLYHPHNRHMNSKIFLKTFGEASQKNKDTLLAYLKETTVLFINAYQQEIIKCIHSRQKEAFETLP